MKFIYFGLLLSATTAYACGGNAYRCKNPDKSVDEMWAVTRKICNNLKEDDCYCYHWAEYYCDPYGDNIEKFKHACVNEGDDWYWTEC
ncbi:2b5ef486-8f2c-4841-ade2-4051bedebba8 [Sclerotinia trifoliorum]|uniref:2b5ef486-8f2c-4841-ade2-4051bedebba8 n=1 Tax=Sclerotinia trifoliorum TaxID=28548 RepID=A0A8H2VNK3_9HELO|nr:2b5ef486-8f2c-4841-ade2-4051bedebba8 [Sclerotinia trifoliorum]